MHVYDSTHKHTHTHTQIGSEGLYRNHCQEVYRFFETRHSDKYKVMPPPHSIFFLRNFFFFEIIARRYTFLRDAALRQV